MIENIFKFLIIAVVGFILIFFLPYPELWILGTRFGISMYIMLIIQHIIFNKKFDDMLKKLDNLEKELNEKSINNKWIWGNYMKYIIKIFLYLFLNFILVLIIGQNFSENDSDLIISMYIFIVVVFVVLNEKLNTILEKLDKQEKESKASENEKIEK